MAMIIFSFMVYIGIRGKFATYRDFATTSDVTVTKDDKP